MAPVSQSRSVYLENLAAADETLDRNDAIITATTRLIGEGKGDESDGYRIINALLDLRRLAQEQHELHAAVLAGSVEQNAAPHVMAFRAWWAILDARVTRFLASFPETDQIGSVREAIAALRESRKDMEGLVS